MKKSRLLGAVCACAFSYTAHATTYNETVDAGESILTAQSVPGGTDLISGSIDTNDADMYGFYWGGGAFFANTIGSPMDTQLFLFDSTGAGVWANDDCVVSCDAQSQITDAGLSAGSYFIAVSGYNNDPLDAGASLIFPSTPFNVQFGPNDGDVLASWSRGNSGSYTINISPTGVVPVPAAVWLFGSGLLGLVGIARRKKSA